MKYSSIAAGALAIALAVATPAQADITKAVYSGVFSMYDETDYLGFGLGSYSKYGTMTFLFDSDTYGSSYDTTIYVGDAAISTLYGSGDYSPGKGYLTLGSFSSGFFGDAVPSQNNSSSYQKVDGVGYANYSSDQVTHSVNLGSSDLEGYYSYKYMYANAYSYNDAFLNDIDPDSPESYKPDFDGSDGVNGYFNFYNSNPNDYFNFSGNFSPLSVTITNLSAGAVPEPSTWAMMVIGMGLAGAALRRRRTSPERGMMAACA